MRLFPALVAPTAIASEESDKWGGEIPTNALGISRLERGYHPAGYWDGPARHQYGRSAASCAP